MADNSDNEGEGSRSAAKEYNERTRRFVENEDVEARAREAGDAIESDEEGAFDEAEQRGKDKAREFEPQEKKDR